VLINDRSSEYTVLLDMDGASFKELELWRTSAKEELTPLGRQQVLGNTAVITLPRKSISTVYGRVN
jgi:hypothetical protein